MSSARAARAVAGELHALVSFGHTGEPQRARRLSLDLVDAGHPDDLSVLGGDPQHGVAGAADQQWRPEPAEPGHAAPA